MGRHQVVLTGSCQDQNIFYPPNIYNEIFSKETERFVKSFPLQEHGYADNNSIQEIDYSTLNTR